ncbi:MAG: phenylalanine--tRNA ligase subunit alpha, partial [Bacteroidota bacterium]
MQTKIAQLREQVEAEIASVATEQQVEKFRIKFLARKGLVAALFDELKNVPASDKPLVGKQLNELRQRAQSLFDARAASLKSAPKVAPQLDPTLPGRRKFRGTKHPLMQTLDEIKSIFVSMGFGVADGPEIEDDWHNFGALNFPPEHPARDMQDTFFVKETILLRTHTSPVQIRVMENNQPPIRTIMPGRAYRNEAVSARSLCNFYQVEGLAVDKGITFSELKGTLLSFARQFYGK